MRTLVVALLLFALAQVGVGAQAGDAQTGKALWEGQTTLCRQCHGVNGEGGFGPDLAGRQLSIEQFRQAIRKPWGIMPAFTEQQLSDREIADLRAHVARLPRIAEPGPWRISVPSGAPKGQELLIATVGCGQCHGRVLGGPRRDAGAVDADYAWFAHLVYEHTTAMPELQALVGEPTARVRMGNYSRVRLPDSLLQEIWLYVVELGFRVPITARLSTGVPAGNGLTYTLTLENEGLPGKGLTAEKLSIALRLPPGSTVANTSGDGYQGVRHDPSSGIDMAVWEVPRMAPKDEQTYTITLSGSGAKMPRGTVSWSRPALGDGSSDRINVALPPSS